VDNSGLEEEKETKVQMKKFGIGNVRGAQYVAKVLIEEDQNDLDRSLRHDAGGSGVWIYVLELEDDCYYVGKTSKDPSVRLEEHRQGNGAAWTRLHEPIRFLCPPRRLDDIEVVYSGLEEEKETKVQMKKFGIPTDGKGVRGAQYVDEVLTEDLRELFRSIGHDSDLCNRCYRFGHFATSCDENNLASGEPLAGRGGGGGSGGGGGIDDDDDDDNDDDDDFDDDDVDDDDECSRCGRSTPTVSSCLAKTPVDGTRLAGTRLDDDDDADDDNDDDDDDDDDDYD
jgi:predicted GIY-YIG superfamily endonuclease